MQARDLMQSRLVTTHEDEPVTALCDRLQAAHVHAAPVVDNDGRLIGIVSIEDVLFGDSLGQERDSPTRVAEIMTSPVFSVTEDQGVAEICETMWNYRVHHLPVEGHGRLVGIVSSLDICRLVKERGLRPATPPKP